MLGDFFGDVRLVMIGIGYEVTISFVKELCRVQRDKGGQFVVRCLIAHRPSGLVVLQRLDDNSRTRYERRLGHLCFRLVRQA